MIPTTRPVLGKDLDTIRQQYGVLVTDACYLFGLSMNRWMKIVREGAELPVKDPTLALLVRFLDEHPEIAVLPKFPKVEEIFRMVNSTQETDQRRFSVLLGSESTACYRWMRSGGARTSPAIQRLLFCLQLAMLARRPEGRAELIEGWGETVKKEGQARGVPDVFEAGRWNLKGMEEESAKISANPESPKLRKKKGLAGKKRVVTPE